MVAEAVRLPRNQQELDSVSAPKLRKMVAYLMTERQGLQQSELLHKGAIAGAILHYGMPIHAADNRVHSCTLLLQRSWIQALPEDFEMRYAPEADGLRAILTSASVLPTAAADAPRLVTP